MPTPITDEQIRHLAALARLELGAAEVRALAGELDAILEQMEALRAVRVPEAVPETAAPSAASLRPDEPDFDALQHSAAELAPAWEESCFLVPRPPGMGDPAGGGAESSG